MTQQNAHNLHNLHNLHYRRRGAAVVAFVITLLMLTLILVGLVLGGARDQDLTVQRMNTLRAYYASEAGLNMAIREVMLNTDADGDGGIGSISNDGNAANNPAFGTARTYVTTSSPAQDQISLTSIGSASLTTRDITAVLAASNGHFGFGTPFSSQQQSIANKQVATKIRIPQPGTLLSVTVYLNGPSPKNTCFAVYDDSGGEPNNLLSQTYALPVGGDSAHFHWLTLFLPSTTVSTGDYWLALGFENTSMAYAFDSVGGQTRYNNNDAVSKGFNTPWGASTGSNTRRINMYTTVASNTTGMLNLAAGTYDNSNPPASGKFRDLTNATNIQSGNDISTNPTHYSAVNFTAASGLVSDCLTAYDTTPVSADQTNFDNSIRVMADVLVTGNSGSRWIGIGALNNEVAGQGGLTLALLDHGNNDMIQLFRTPSDGNISGSTAIASSATFNDIRQNRWFRLVMDISISYDTLQVDGRVYAHATTSDPTSSVIGTPLQTLSYTGTVSGLTGLQKSGEITLGFDTDDNASRGSITNLEIDSDIGKSNTASLATWSEVKPY